MQKLKVRVRKVAGRWFAGRDNIHWWDDAKPGHSALSAIRRYLAWEAL